MKLTNMRIISGTKKGKKILLPDASITRPLKDNVKENIFNILTHNRDFKINFKDINVIDFFSGSGSFGLECLSRSAKKVFFLESNSKTQNTLFRNLSNNFPKYKYEICKKDFFKLNKSSLIENFKPKIIFFDPPYAIENFDKIYEFINSLKNLKDTLLILHIEKSRHIYFENFKFNSEKIYGISKIVFLRN